MSMDDRDGKIWMDGKMVEWRDAKIHVLTHTLHYGCGAFEGVRAYKTDKGTAIFRLREHTERLFNSAKILRMPMPFKLDELMQALTELQRLDLIGRRDVGHRRHPVGGALVVGREHADCDAKETARTHRDVSSGKSE